jgi:ssDNA-binding Zn-finger/Zn-ribbon topoisomerase 1
VSRDVSAFGIVCRECGADLVHRMPKPGGKRFTPFYGCSRYPRCTATVTEREMDCAVSGEPDHSLDGLDRDWGDL